MQLPLEGIGERAAASATAFLAVFPDPDTARHLTRLALRLRADCALQGRPRPARLLHVTLHFLGRVAGSTQTQLDGVAAAAATVVLPAFDVSFDRVASFSGRPGNLPLVLAGDAGVAGVAALHDALAGALVRSGVKLPAGAPGYTPHLTLLYGDRAVEPRPVEPVRWRVREFVLVCSFTGQSRYEVLARFPLGP